MDELIYLLIKLIAGMFGGDAKGPAGPGRPGGAPLPRRPPPLGQQPQIRPRTKVPGPPQMRVLLGKMPPRLPARAAAPAPLPVPAPPPARPTPPQLQPNRTPSTVDAATIRRWLRPTTLHAQFILSEIFQPPLSIRPPRE